MIYVQNPSSLFKMKLIPVWMMAAFEAGFINSMGFLATGEYVSHVTGFGTMVGISFRTDDIITAMKIASIPLIFIFGAFLSSAFLGKLTKKNSYPPYYLIQVFISSLLGLTLIGVENMHAIRDGLKLEQLSFDFVFILILCMVCGLKNGLVTMATGGRIRITHMTGTATDIGINLWQESNYKLGKKEKPRSMNLTRILVLFSFAFGAGTSALIYPHMGPEGLAISFAISIFLTALSTYNWVYLKHRHPFKIVQKKGPV